MMFFLDEAIAKHRVLFRGTGNSCSFQPATGKMKRIAVFLLILFYGLSVGGCSLARSGVNVPAGPVPQLHIGRLVTEVCRTVQRCHPAEAVLPAPPAYLDALLADNRLVIGLGVGTADLAPVSVSPDPGALFFRSAFRIRNRRISVEARLILDRCGFRQALEECEILFVATHARYGAGPAFLKDGKALPFRMQKTPGYVITMSEDEVSGYQGKVKRTYPGFLKKKKFYDFEPDSTDLDGTVPYPGYQLLVLSTCSSKKHFLDEVTWLRKKNPSTAVFTTGPCAMDPGFRPFKRMLYSILMGNGIKQVVFQMNREYRTIAWENIRKNARTKAKDNKSAWTVVDEMYAIGIHHLN